MKFINSENKLSLEELKEFENQMGINLPEEFKTVYLKCNGGEISLRE